MVDEKIDFVILWVDGNDPKWLKEKNKYNSLQGDSNENRFRDWNTLKYLFRGIESYTNWVNKIYFVTWGHIPKWLNLKNEKIVVIKHGDFIPNEYLPTFNSNVIEINLHRIKGLSDKFVILNDDLIFLKKMSKLDFFEKGLPKDIYVETIKKKPSKRHICMRKNYLECINKHFNKKISFKKNWRKYINIRYGILNFKTLSCLKYDKYIDFFNPHMSQSFLKSTFEDLWKNEGERLNLSCRNKFRADNDMGTTICRYWQLAKGDFYPSAKMGKYFSISKNNIKLIETIKGKKYKMICINDDIIEIDYENSKKEIQKALETKFPNKCEYEI